MNDAINKQKAAAYDVIIAGGGMTGSFLACALGDSSLKVAVIERQTPPTAMSAAYDVRVSALTLASSTMLDALGAWHAVVDRRVAPVRAMQVWDAGGDGEIRFDAAEIGEQELAYIAENRVIVAALYERLQQHTNVHWVNGAIEHSVLDNDVLYATLDDGRSLRARLLVGADGADSAVRQQMNISRRALDLGQQAIVANVRTEQPHAGVAYQRFLATGPLAFLPLPDANAMSIVWSVDRSRADELLMLEDVAFASELTNAIEGRLGPVQMLTPRAAFPLALTHADSYIHERTALIGDAAHTVHPLAGQGVNLGFLDAACLAEVLRAAAEERRDIGARHVLRRYERWRKGDNLAMLAVTGGFRYLFGNDWPVVAQLRNAGLSGTNRFGLLKGSIIRRAAGLTGDLPQLARRRLAG